MTALRIVLRQPGRSPGFRAIALFPRALGISATAIVLCWTCHLVRHPLPAVPLLLAPVAVLACLLPARRATRVSPMAALRAE